MFFLEIAQLVFSAHYNVDKIKEKQPFSGKFIAVKCLNMIRNVENSFCRTIDIRKRL